MSTLTKLYEKTEKINIFHQVVEYAIKVKARGITYS